MIQVSEFNPNYLHLDENAKTLERC